VVGHVIAIARREKCRDRGVVETELHRVGAALDEEADAGFTAAQSFVWVERIAVVAARRERDECGARERRPGPVV
jgi:hypothetical protein